MKLWKDLACTIPADKNGDTVAAITHLNEVDDAPTMFQLDPRKRPQVWVVHSQMPMPDIDFGGQHDQ